MAKSTQVQRRAAVVVAMVVGLIGSMLIFSNAGAASASALDYSQCSNDAPPSTSTACPGSWINGILQASNSHYREDEVTAQRLIVKVGSAGTHTITLRYEARKGGASDGNHAYDSLTTWNLTQSTANRCIGITGTPLRNAIGCSATNTDTLSPTFADIPPDTTSVAPFASKGASVVNPFGGANVADTGQTFLRQIPGVMTMFGQGALVSVTAATHDNAAGGGDDYASTTVSFTTTSNNATVQLLFGGHIAAPTGLRGWAPGRGAANISGGPYHIKLDLVDGASVGNRDNQLMGSAILPFFAATQFTTVAQQPIVAAGVATNVSDQATAVTEDGGNLVGTTTTFTLHGPFAAGATPACIRTGTTGANQVASTTGTFVAKAGTTNQFVATGTAVSATLAVGDYYWLATYPANAQNAGNSHDGCDNGGLGSPDPAEKVSAIDSVTLLGAKVVLTAGTPSGTASFKLYGPADATCIGTAVSDQSVVSLATDDPRPVATPNTYAAVTAGTYNWVVTFTPTGGTTVTIKACGKQTAVVSY